MDFTKDELDQFSKKFKFNLLGWYMGSNMAIKRVYQYI